MPVYDLNLTLNHDLQIADVVAWSVTFVDPRLARRGQSTKAQMLRHVDGVSRDRLPWNCDAVTPELTETHTLAWGVKPQTEE